MALTLSSLGIEPLKIDNINADEQIEDYCVNKMNNTENVSSQLIISLNPEITDKLIDNLKNKLSKNLVMNKKTFIRKLTSDNFQDELIKYIDKYTKNIKDINTILDLEDLDKPKLLFGNSEFVEYNIQLLAELIILDNKVKNYLEGLVLKILNKDVLEGEIFNHLKKLTVYKTPIFDDLLDVIIKYVNITETNNYEGYPEYMKNLDELNIKIMKIFNVNKFLKKYFSGNNYDDIYTEIYNDIFINIIPKINSHNYVSFSIINILYKKISTVLNIISKDKSDYYRTNISHMFKKILRKIKLDNISDLLNLYNTLDKTEKIDIISYVSKNLDNEYFSNILNIIFTINDNEIYTLAEIFNQLQDLGKVLINFKHKLVNNVWNLNANEINKLIIFIKNLSITFSPNKTIIDNIITIIEDKNTSDHINMLINPYKVFHFTKGIWDYPLNNEYFRISNYNLRVFKEELNAINMFTENNKSQIVFGTKGKIIIELDDGNKKCLCEFIPVQAIIINYLLSDENINEETLDNILKTLNINYKEYIINSLSDLIKINIVDGKNVYELVEELPYSGKMNFANKYFITTVDTDKIVEKELAHTTYELCASNIIHYIKQNENKELNDIFEYTKNEISRFKVINMEEFKKYIEILETKDYIECNDNKYKYLVY